MRSPAATRRSLFRAGQSGHEQSSHESVARYFLTASFDPALLAPQRGQLEQSEASALRGESRMVWCGGGWPLGHWQRGQSDRSRDV